MRWRFVDRIVAFEPWSRIRGCKAVSLEEYSLGRVLGHEAFLPDALLLESLVQLTRWLVSASSAFRCSAILTAVDELRVLGRATMGDTLTVDAIARERAGAVLAACCTSCVQGRMIAQGTITVQLVPLPELVEAECVEVLWRELYVKAQGA